MSQGLESQTLKGERRDNMKYNYSKLLGRIREYGFTHERLADAIGKNKGTLSTKFKGKYDFTASEMDAICELLDIPNEEIGIYFFAK